MLNNLRSPFGFSLSPLFFNQLLLLTSPCWRNIIVIAFCLSWPFTSCTWVESLKLCFAVLSVMSYSMAVRARGVFECWWLQLKPMLFFLDCRHTPMNVFLTTHPHSWALLPIFKTNHSFSTNFTLFWLHFWLFSSIFDCFYPFFNWFYSFSITFFFLTIPC